MDFNSTSCCAIEEIKNLSNFSSALAAMRSFCESSLTKNLAFKSVAAAPDTLFSFYLFTGAINGYLGDYGGNFERFIKEHNLGEVWASPKIKNEAFHAERSNQVWIWMPNTKALRAWWNAQQPPKPVTPILKPMTPTLDLNLSESGEQIK